MQVNLDKIVVESVVAELPDVCPSDGCSADLMGVNALTEEQLIYASQEASIVGATIQRDTGYEDDADVAQYVTGYRCTACGAEIVSTVDD